MATLVRMVEPGCYTCRSTLNTDAPDRERVLLTRHWRAAHAFDAALPGWLILAPTAHVASLDQLTPEAAAELGTILRNLTAALRTVTGCLKTYVLLVAEKPGFAHLHFHVVPRAANIIDEHKGPGIFGLLSVSTDKQVTFAEQDRIAKAIRRELTVQDA